MSTSKTRQEFRMEAIGRLIEIRDEAFSKLSELEYEAIKVAIELISLNYSECERKKENG